MADRIEVVPLKNGTWKVRYGSESSSHDTRSDAIRAAYKLRGDQVSVLTNPDGQEVGRVILVGEPVPIMLLRQDGSDHGELHSGSQTQQLQSVTR